LDLPDDDEVNEFFDKMRKKSAQKLQALLEQFQDSNLEVTVETVINNRSRGIVAYCMEKGVDLIVMSSHAIDPAVKRSDWATISYQVSLVCPCSIMLVKPPAD
jgi:nucleotide-binding universal stress UspA family protein